MSRKDRRLDRHSRSLLAAFAIDHGPAEKAGCPDRTQALSLPDLLVVSIDFKDYRTHTGTNGVKRGIVIPSVTYKNQGSVSSGAFQLAWEYFDYGTNSWQFWLQSAPLTNSLGAGQSFTEGGHLADEFGWNIGANWPKFRCRLDINSAVTESNETNNNLEKTFSPLTIGPSSRNSDHQEIAGPISSKENLRRSQGQRRGVEVGAVGQNDDRDPRVGKPLDGRAEAPRFPVMPHPGMAFPGIQEPAESV